MFRRPTFPELLNTSVVCVRESTHLCRTLDEAKQRKIRQRLRRLEKIRRRIAMRPAFIAKTANESVADLSLDILQGNEQLTTLAPSSTA